MAGEGFRQGQHMHAWWGQIQREQGVSSWEGAALTLSAHRQALLALPLLLLLSTPPCAPQVSGIRGDGKQPHTHRRGLAHRLGKERLDCQNRLSGLSPSSAGLRFLLY